MTQELRIAKNMALEKLLISLCMHSLIFKLQKLTVKKISLEKLKLGLGNMNIGLNSFFALKKLRDDLINLILSEETINYRR